MLVMEALQKEIESARQLLKGVCNRVIAGNRVFPDHRSKQTNAFRAVIHNSEFESIFHGRQSLRERMCFPAIATCAHWGAMQFN